MKAKGKYGREGMDGRRVETVQTDKPVEYDAAEEAFLQGEDDRPTLCTKEDSDRICRVFEKHGWDGVLIGGCPTRTYDSVSMPAHYCRGRTYEPKDVIRDWGLNYNLGCAVKYISRAGRKGDALEDLRKARQYLDFEIDALMKETKQ